MFAYCGNNPVIKKDTNGQLGVLALCAIGGIASGLMDYAGQVFQNFKGGKRGAEAWTSVSWGSVAASTFSGALSAIPGGGVVAEIVDIIVSPAIEQGVDCLVERLDNDPNTAGTWDSMTYVTDIGKSALSAFVSNKLSIGDDIPRYIRDIKNDARALGIKGTKKLTRYLNQTQASTLVRNAFYDATMSSVYPWENYSPTSV